MSPWMVGTLGALLLSRFGNAQLSSCTDVGCPMTYPYSACSLNDQQLYSLGVTTITTDLSTDPLTWMVGYIPRPSMEGKHVAPDSRAFYLGQPASLDLRQDDSVTACALFFNKVAPKLKFNSTESAPDALTSRGSCGDALTDSCVADWTSQAQKVAAYGKDVNFTCESLADELRASPPPSCEVVKKSWGDVVAQAISGPNMSFPTATNDCHLTMFRSYSQTKIFSINSTHDDMFREITPVLTIIRPKDSVANMSSEAQLSCLKPIYDGVRSNTGFAGDAVGQSAYPVFAIIFLVVFGLFSLF